MTEAASAVLSHPDARARRAPVAATCPFHDGLATLDLLLAELDPRDRELFDAALDLRCLANGTDANACMAQLLRVRAMLAGRHYLAFYRVRCWAKNSFRVEVRSRQAGASVVLELPLDVARMDEIVDSSLAIACARGEALAAPSVKIVFAGGSAG